MAKTQTTLNIPHLRMVGGTDFNASLKRHAVRVPSAKSTFLVKDEEKGSFSASATQDGWLFINACVPFDVGTAMVETYVAAQG